MLGATPAAPPTSEGSRAGVARLSRRAAPLPGLALAAGTGLGHLVAARANPLATLEEGDDLEKVHHQWSTPSYAGLLVKSVHVAPQPSLYKDFPGSPTVALPPPPAPGGLPPEMAIAQRRSARAYADRPVTLPELGRLLHYVAGITDRRDSTLAFQAVPSSGALYPIKVYPVVFHVADVAPDVYHYGVQQHALEPVRSGDFRQDVFHASRVPGDDFWGLLA